MQRHGAGVVHEDPVVFAGDSDSYQRPLSETDEMPEGDIGDPLFDEGVGSTVAGMGGVEGGGAFGATSASAMLDEATRGHGLYGDMRPGHARAQREGAEVDVKGARPWERGCASRACLAVPGATLPNAHDSAKVVLAGALGAPLFSSREKQENQCFFHTFLELRFHSPKIPCKT